MALALTQNFPNDTTLRGIHMTVYQAWTQRDPIGRSQIFNVYDSSQYREHALTFGGLGTFDTKAEGEAVNYDAPNEGFLTTFTHTNRAKGIRISEEQWSDDLYGIMDDSPAELGRMAYATEETTLANHFNNGFDSNYTGGDGVELFSSAHVRENGETYKNELTNKANLSVASLEQMLIDFRNQRDGGGKRLQIQPKVLLVPPDLQWTASKLLGSSQDPESELNAINPLNDLGLKICVWDYLTDTSAWGVLAAKENHKLSVYDRKSFTTADIFDFDTGDIKFKGWYRQSSGWADPRGVFFTEGA